MMMKKNPGLPCCTLLSLHLPELRTVSHSWSNELWEKWSERYKWWHLMRAFLRIVDAADVLIIIFTNHFLGLFHRQKNHGTEEEQERVMLEPVHKSWMTTLSIGNYFPETYLKWWAYNWAIMTFNGKIFFCVSEHTIIVCAPEKFLNWYSALDCTSKSCVNSWHFKPNKQGLDRSQSWKDFSSLAE